MMQNFGFKDLSHVQSRRNLLKYLVRVDMASDWFTRIYRSILAEQISSKIEIACKLGCELFLSPQKFRSHGNSLLSSPHPLDFNMLVIFSLKNVKQGHKFEVAYLYTC